jgi:hypothetical protein
MFCNLVGVDVACEAILQPMAFSCSTTATSVRATSRKDFMETIIKVQHVTLVPTACQCVLERFIVCLGLPSMLSATSQSLHFAHGWCGTRFLMVRQMVCSLFRCHLSHCESVDDTTSFPYQPTSALLSPCGPCCWNTSSCTLACCRSSVSCTMSRTDYAPKAFNYSLYSFDSHMLWMGVE